MIDRSKVKKMYVWGEDLERKRMRYVLDTFSDGSCLVVPEFAEYRFENGGKYVTLDYPHYEEITEEKYRPFKVEEITEEFFDYLFRNTTDGKIHRITTIDYGSELCIRVSDGWMSLEHLFNNYKVKKPVYSVNDDGTITKTFTDWMPVGVKED